jgi:hypothetical protein
MIMNLEGSYRGLYEVLFQHLPGRTKENHKNLSQVSRYATLDSNRTPPENKSTVLSADQPVRSPASLLKACVELYLHSSIGVHWVALNEMQEFYLYLAYIVRISVQYSDCLEEDIFLRNFYYCGSSLLWS